MKELKDLRYIEIKEMIKDLNRNEQLAFYKERMKIESQVWLGVVESKYNYITIHCDNNCLKEQIGISLKEFIKIQDEVNDELGL